MKCDIASWGNKEVACSQTSEEDCANCDRAWGYMRFVGCASYTPKTKDWRMMKDGNDLRVLKIFDDGDPLTYCWRISKGVFQTDPPFTDFPWEKLPS